MMFSYVASCILHVTDTDNKVTSNIAHLSVGQVDQLIGLANLLLPRAAA